jgi:mono/diheme cytochrome c family protein
LAGFVVLLGVVRIRGRAVPLLVAAIALAPAGLSACGGGNGDGGGAGAAEGNAEAGKTVFADAGCGNCHTLEAAGSNGTTGPNLDERQPSTDEVVEQVTNGGGGMPAFKDKLSEQQIADVAAFVSESAGG